MLLTFVINFTRVELVTFVVDPVETLIRWIWILQDRTHARLLRFPFRDICLFGSTRISGCGPDGPCTSDTPLRSLGKNGQLYFTRIQWVALLEQLSFNWQVAMDFIQPRLDQSRPSSVKGNVPKIWAIAEWKKLLKWSMFIIIKRGIRSASKPRRYD
jgi:hypothetical protein